MGGHAQTLEGHGRTIYIELCFCKIQTRTRREFEVACFDQINQPGERDNRPARNTDKPAPDSLVWFPDRTTQCEIREHNPLGYIRIDIPRGTNHRRARDWWSLKTLDGEQDVIEDRRCSHTRSADLA